MLIFPDNFDSGNMVKGCLQFCQHLLILLWVAVGTLTVNGPFRELLLPDDCYGSDKPSLTKPSCSFLLHDNFTGAIKISCPEVGVMRVFGDYGLFRINCSASYPLDFNFDGTKPTEAINVAVERVLDRNISREDCQYRAFVDIVSIKSLFLQYGNHSHGGNQNFALEPAFRYSRSGKFIFSGFNEFAHISTSFYIFFEEPLALPDFINHSDLEVAATNGTVQSLMVPCRPTHYDLAVDMRTVENHTFSNMSYSPTTGFTLFRVNVKNLSSNYICELKRSDKNVSLALISSNNSTLEYWKGSADDPDVQLSPSLVNQGFGLYGTKITCRCVANMTRHGPIVLAAIGSANPFEFRFKREFSLPMFANRSYTVKIGNKLLTFPRHRFIKNAISEQVVSVYCGDNERHQTVSYGTVVSGDTFIFDFNQDWASIERSATTIDSWFKSGHDHEDQNIYENQRVQFKCRISTFVFLAPCIWYVKYKNGTISDEFYDYNWINGISYFSKTVNVDMDTVICAASLFNLNQWWNTTIDVSVQGCIEPVFNNPDNETLYRFAENSKQILNCSARGSPNPNVSWHRDGGPVISTGRGYALLEFPKVQLKDRGEYICTATNCANKRLARFNVEIYSEPLVSTTLLILFAVLSAIVVLTWIGAALVVKCFRKKTGGLSLKEVEEFMTGKFRSVDYQSTVLNRFVPSSLPYDKKLEVSRNRFQIDKTKRLGKPGASGTVYKCLLDEKPAASKENNDINSLKSLLSELKVLMYLGSHGNVVSLLGAYTMKLREGKVNLFLEYCPLGNLQDFLEAGRSQFEADQRNRGSVDSVMSGKQYTLEDLYNWAIQIAQGMLYLSEKMIIHADLATRNVLLTGTRVAKIADFGLSNRLYEYSEYIQLKDEKLPWRWLALESMMEAKFTSLSDVWSFGVTLWEAFSLGEEPFPECSWGIPFITQIDNGMRLKKPKYSSTDLYENVMMQCWQKDPSLRPSFESIRATLKDLRKSIIVPSAYRSIICFSNSEDPVSVFYSNENESLCR